MAAPGKSLRRVIRLVLMALSFVRLIAYPGLLPAQSFVLYTLLTAFVAITSALSNLGLPELLYESLEYKKHGHPSAFSATVVIAAAVSLFTMVTILVFKSVIRSALFPNLDLSYRTWLCLAMLSASSILSLCSSALVKSSVNEFAFPVLLAIKSLAPLIFIIIYSLTGLRLAMPGDLVVDCLMLIESIACVAQFIFSLYLLRDHKSPMSPSFSGDYLSFCSLQELCGQVYSFLLSSYPKCLTHYMSSIALPLFQNLEKLILLRFLPSSLYQDYAYFSALFAIVQAAYNSYLQMTTYRLAKFRLACHSAQLLFSAINKAPYCPDILIAIVASLAFLSISLLANYGAWTSIPILHGIHGSAFLSPPSAAPAAIASLCLPVLALNYYAYLSGSFHRISLDAMISLLPSTILACAAMVFTKSIIAYAAVFMSTRLILSLFVYYPSIVRARAVFILSR